MKRQPKAISTPYSGVREVGDNTPCLKHFFRCQSAGASLVDSKGGVSWTPPVNVLKYNSTLQSYSTNMVAASLPILTEGSFYKFDGTKAALYFVSCRGVSGPDVRFAWGDNNSLLTPTNGSGIGLVGTHAAVLDLSMTSNLGSSFAGALNKSTGNSDDATHFNVIGVDFYMYLAYTPGVGVSKYAIYNTNTGVELTFGDNSGLTDIGAYQPYSCIRFSGIELYSAMLFQFQTASLPADYDVAAAWMAISHKNGERYSWPRWIGQ